MNPADNINALMQEVAIIKAKQDLFDSSLSVLKPLHGLVERLNANIESLTAQMSSVNERMAKSVESSDAKLKDQGVRIGKAELDAAQHTLLLGKLSERMDGAETDIKEIKLKGSKRWEAVVEKIGYIILCAVIMFLLYQIGL